MLGPGPRSEFQTIATRTQGVFFSEHVPCLAEQTNKLTVVHSLLHKDNGHPGAAYRGGPRPPVSAGHEPGG